MVCVGILILCATPTAARRLIGTRTERPVANLQAFITKNPLNDNDKAMLKTIINARMNGAMLKIAPNFSENGDAAHRLISAQSERLGGFESPAGKVYGNGILKLMQ
jgi:hypothetical protein